MLEDRDSLLGAQDKQIEKFKIIQR